MIGTNTEKNFDIENYEEFYEHHHFQPMSEDEAFRVNEIIPRFGWAFDEVEELKPKNLLDLGCLDGSFALSVGSQLGVNVIGVDLTKDGIEIANQRAKEYAAKKHEVFRANFFQGTIEDWLTKYARGLEMKEKSGGKLAGTYEKFDVVTCFEVIEHVKDVPLLLSLIDKVLAPGGTVLISTPAFESPVFGKDDEQNKCHIRLYTMEDEDREEENKYGHVRKATSITKEIGKDRIKDIGVFNHLINVRYQ